MTATLQRPTELGATQERGMEPATEVIGNSSSAPAGGCGSRRVTLSTFNGTSRRVASRHVASRPVVKSHQHTIKCISTGKRVSNLPPGL